MAIDHKGRGGLAAVLLDKKQKDKPDNARYNKEIAALRQQSWPPSPYAPDHFACFSFPDGSQMYQSYSSGSGTSPGC